MKILVVVVEITPGVTEVEHALAGRKCLRAWSEQPVDIEIGDDVLFLRAKPMDQPIRVTLVTAPRETCQRGGSRLFGPN